MITSADLQPAKTHHYSFDPSETEIINIISKYFDGIDLPILIDDLERLLGPHADKPVDKKLIVRNPPPTFIVRFYSINYMDDDKGLMLSRIFQYEGDDLTVCHEFLVLPKSTRGHSLGKKVLSAFLEQYEKMNVKRITVWAGLEDGGAVWAKAGFKATRKNEIDRILAKAKTKLASNPVILKVVKDTYDNYYNNEPSGRAFPIQNWVNLPGMELILKQQDLNWHGEIDLTNQDDLRNFKRYVGKKH